jgi:glycerol dehydrogenase
MHGEKVAFGVASQLCLDPDVPTRDAYAIIDWCIAIGLPVTFAELSLEGVSRGRLKLIGDICAGPGSLCANHCFEVTSEGVVDAMLAADALGRERKKRAQ